MCVKTEKKMERVVITRRSSKRRWIESKSINVSKTIFIMMFVFLCVMTQETSAQLGVRVSLC
jgi:hypothetical protein